jgi:hypothetical protein
MVKRLEREGNQIILYTEGEICSTPREFAGSKLFEKVFGMYVSFLQERDSPMLELWDAKLETSEEKRSTLSLLRALVEDSLEQTATITPGADRFLMRRDALHEFVESFYDYWRSFDRFMVCHSEDGFDRFDRQPYRTFTATGERLNNLVRAVYRDICEHILGICPRVYRQVAAGCEVEMITLKREASLPKRYTELLDGIPFIRQVLLSPPLIINPPMNKRTGQFKKVDENPLDDLSLEKSQWICYPAQVGPMVVFIYFHQRFIGLGSALANLFELASDGQITSGPDAIFLYGAPADSLARFGDLPTVFHDDSDNSLLVAAVPGEDRFGYFGYIKKMALTLHNIVMMKRGRMPYHGAMARVVLRNGASANILLIGDTATGKSESLEAFRTLGWEQIRELRIIADDMGSIEVDNGALRGYGTEVGAFVRLDDLQHGYAFGQMDRAIIMNPQKTNARIVLPVTTMTEILRGWPLDIILYANNYDEVDEERPIIQRFDSADDALHTFREGAAMAKGTTTSTGLVHSYFANIFGPAQYRDLHDDLARATFEAAFTGGVFVGQMRTRLGVPGYESSGPEEAAKALFELIAQQ